MTPFMKLFMGLALCGCTLPPLEEARPAPPADHGPGFVRWHEAPAAECSRCHGPEPCARCHAQRAPADHGPGYAGLPHALAAATADRCATCHTPTLCTACHASGR